MKLRLLFLLSLLCLASAHAARKSSSGSKKTGYGYTNPKTTRVKPAVTKDGTFRQGHYRTAPNNTQTDNYSTKGNSNPMTGEKGGRYADK